MERYSEYKDSGVEWLGEIPRHWELIKNKYLFSESDERNVFGEYKLLSFSKSKGIIPYDQNTDKESSAEDIRNYKVLHIGQLLENRLQAWNGMFQDSSVEGCVSPDYSVFNLIYSNANIKYYSYLFKTDLYIAQWANASKGIGSGFNRLYTPQFGNIVSLVPPIEEQNAIVAYLDKVTSKIDAAIAQQQKMIELLNERKQIIINNAVTKGLDPNAKMKPSGIPWLGNINYRWNLYKLKHLLKSPLIYGANESAESEDKSYPRYIRITDIDEDGKLRLDTFKSLLPSKAHPYLLRQGDILFARSGATAGKTFLYNEIEKACFAGYLIKASLENNILPQYLMYYTKSGAYDNWRKGIFIQATIPNIGADKYANLQIPLPTLQEQETIVMALDAATEKFTKAIHTCKEQITLLQERKQIIINDVVTGKQKV